MTRMACVALVFVGCVGDVANPSAAKDGGAADAGGYPDDPSVRYVFVTSGTFAPGKDFNGVSRADDLCTQIAKQAGIPGTYRAWISDQNSSPSTRFTQSTKPYVLLDRTVVAPDFAWFKDPNHSLQHPIDRDEHDKLLPIAPNTSCGKVASSMVWTCTDNDGTRSNVPNDCAEWASASATSSGISGSTATGSSPDWTNDSAACTPTCDTKNAFYCFEQ